jgi:uncharacterized membrane protein YecN with MAPEG domain
MLTFVFTGLFGIFFAFLTLNVIRIRIKDKQPIGHDNNLLLAKSVRAHGNFAEYIPFALLLSFFCEAGGVERNTIFYLLTALFIGRLLHLYSVFASGPIKKNLAFRGTGMVITVTVILIFSIKLLSAGHM